MIDRHQCIVCGDVLGVTWNIDHFDETMCPPCSDGPGCSSCGAVTGGAGPRRRTVLADGRVRCQRCSQGAVDAQGDVAAVVGLVRPLLHSWGIRLPNRVRVELASPTAIEARTGRSLHGLTITRWLPGALAEVVEIRIVDGLPATQFGEVLAHEMGHAWLAGCPGGERSGDEEEGICELLGSWWLQHRGGRLAAQLLASMEASTDPVYGEEFRRARDRSRGMSPNEVVARIQRTGRL